MKIPWLNLIFLLCSALAQCMNGHAYYSAALNQQHLITNTSFERALRQTTEKPKKVVFLTGAVGFIGSNFLRYMFYKYPDYHFIVLDALTYAGNPENIPAEIKDSPRFEFWYGSVTNPNLVNPLMSRANFVVHFAAESHVSRSIFDDSVFFHTDVIGTQVMMSALIKSPNVERFIHISTSEVYGTAETEPMGEEHLLNPRSPYAAAKAGADRLVYSYYCTYNEKAPALIIRPFNNYGPNQHIEKCIPRFITSAIKGEQLTVHGDGFAKRDWLHVTDTCRALDKALHVEDFSTIRHQVINLGSGVATSILDIAHEILDSLGLSHNQISFIGDRPGQVACHISSTAKAKELLGWEAEVSLKEGIKDCVNWYKNNESWWQKLEWMKHIPIQTTNNTVEKH